jgi:hypothetical protein
VAPSSIFFRKIVVIDRLHFSVVDSNLMIPYSTAAEGNIPSCNARCAQTCQSVAIVGLSCSHGMGRFHDQVLPALFRRTPGSCRRDYYTSEKHEVVQGVKDPRGPDGTHGHAQAWAPV